MFSELWFGLVFKKEMGIAAKILGFHNFFFSLIFQMNCHFVNIEESVRKPDVPNLPGVQAPAASAFFLIKHL